MRYLQIKYNISYMKRYIYIIFISLLICFLYTSCKKEGYINKPNKDKPDDLQFYACHDYNDINIGKQSYTTMGNNNYMLKKHDIGEPQRGAYSYFLDKYKLRNYDEIFHAPICESEYNFRYINNLKQPEILEHSDAGQEKLMLKVEEEYEKNSIKDPFFKYVNPNNIGNTLIYSDNALKMFLNTHISSNEEQLSDRLDSDKYVPKP